MFFDPPGGRAGQIFFLTMIILNSASHSAPFPGQKGNQFAKEVIWIILRIFKCRRYWQHFPPTNKMYLICSKERQESPHTGVFEVPSVM